MKPSLSSEKKVIYDQDGLGRRDHNLYGLFLLLQAPGVELVGLTTVSGREWSPRQVPRALLDLELLGPPEIPVAQGAVFPLVNSPARSAAWESLHGPLFDTLCHELHELDQPTDADPFYIPGFLEDPPRTKAVDEPAAAFMVRMARKHPGELAIVATGPLTNLALACRLDPEFPRLVKEVVFVGGRFMPYSRTGYFTRCPSRREVNFRHDPEAAHIVLQANWNRLVCLPRDLTDPIRVTAEMHEAVAKARTPVGRFVKGLKYDLYAKGDAIAAAVCIEPGLVADRDRVCLDVDLDPQGANYGQLLNWRDIDHCPAHHGPPVEVVTSVNEKAFTQAFVRWCLSRTKGKGHRGHGAPTQRTRRNNPRSLNAKAPRGKGRKGPKPVP